MIVDALPFDTTQVTSDKNYSHPKWGDCNHPLQEGHMICREREREPLCAGFKPRQGAKALGMGYEVERAPTLETTMNAGVLIMNEEPILPESNQNHATVQTGGICTALPAAMGMGGGYVPMVFDNHSQDTRFTGPVDVSQTINGHAGTGGNNTPLAVCMDNNGTENQNTDETMQAKENGGNKINSNPVVKTSYVVRRLTPIECARLQGFPDDWCELGEWIDENGKKHKDADSPKYKAYGNSCALPFWRWLARRITAEYVGPVKMCSLFSGIGAFELVFKECGVEPVWSSEVEPFCIAVLKKHFGDEEKGEVGDVRKYL